MQRNTQANSGKKNPTIITIDARKDLDKIQHPLVIKTMKNLEIE
jgi:hypothetical protein